MRLSPQTQIGGRRQQVDDLEQALARQIRQRLLVRRMEVEGMQARLVSLDPRGCFSVAMRSSNRRPQGKWWPRSGKSTRAIDYASWWQMATSRPQF